jgi:hypothetical protein
MRNPKTCNLEPLSLVADAAGIPGLDPMAGEARSISLHIISVHV